MLCTHMYTMVCTYNTLFTLRSNFKTWTLADVHIICDVVYVWVYIAPLFL